MVFGHHILIKKYVCNLFLSYFWFSACKWIHYPDQYIAINNIKEITVSSVEECKKLCTLEDGCKSIDYQNSTLTCFLSLMDHANAVAGHHIRDNVDFDLYEYTC